MNVKTLLFAGALFSVFAAGASAETADRTKPIEVNAHNFSGDEIKQVAIYTGAVEVHQGTLEILGDKLTMTVIGAPVRMKERRDPKVKGVDEWVHASALKAVYDEKNDKIIFTDSAKLARSENGLVKDSAAGARITYDLLNAKSRVEGETVNGQKTRVSTVLAPRAKNGTTQPAPRRAAPAPMTGSSRLE